MRRILRSSALFPSLLGIAALAALAGVLWPALRPAIMVDAGGYPLSGTATWWTCPSCGTRVFLGEDPAIPEDLCSGCGRPRGTTRLPGP